MVKITNKFGDEKRGKQDTAVYQMHYGKQVRRVREEKKDANTPKQLQQRARFKRGTDFALKLTKPERDFIKKYIDDAGIRTPAGNPITWYNFAKNIAMTVPRVSYRFMEVAGFHPAPFSAWRFRRRVVFHNGGTTQTNFQVLLILTPANFDYTKVRADGGDIRFSRTDGTTLLPYHIETWVSGGTSRIWINVDNVPHGTNHICFIYFGNPAATSASSGAAFDWFDDFIGTVIDTTRWNIVNATGWSVGGGELRGTNSTGRLLSHSVFSAPTIQEVRARIVAHNPDGHNLGGFWLSTTNGFTIMIHRNPVHPTLLDAINNEGTWSHIGAVFPIDNVPFLLRFTVWGTNVNLRITNLNTGAVTYDVTHTNTVSAERIMLGLRADNAGGGQAYDTRWDWIRIRKFASPEPTFSSFGPEEEGAVVNEFSHLTINHPAIERWELLNAAGGVIKSEAGLSRLTDRIVSSVFRDAVIHGVRRIRVRTLAGLSYDFDVR